MATLEELIANAVVETLKKKETDDVIKIGVSARHVHLSQKGLMNYDIRKSLRKRSFYS